MGMFNNTNTSEQLDDLQKRVCQLNVKLDDLLALVKQNDWKKKQENDGELA